MENIRITKIDNHYIVEKGIPKWTLFGVKYKWIPFVTPTGMKDECWKHSNYDFAFDNTISEIRKALNQKFGTRSNDF